MKKILFILLFLLTAIPFQATARQWTVDAVHTNFYFSIKHTYATVRGQFADFSGNVIFDPANPAMSSFDFVIKADSVNTNESKRDTHLRSPDFFDTARYPTITFKSSKVTRKGENLLVDGTLTIKDVSKNITLKFVYHGQKDNPLMPGGIVAGFDAEVTIDRLAYHVGDGKFSRMGVVGKDVEVLLTMELLADK